MLLCSIFYPNPVSYSTGAQTSTTQSLPTSQKETVTILLYNIHIVHIQDISTNWTTHLPPFQNTTL